MTAPSLTSGPFPPTGIQAPVLILDGGLATTLEVRGQDLSGDLWSARLLLEDPDAVRRVHTDFLEAGADVITTASYQASLPGFARRGIPEEEGWELLRLASRLAVEARDAFWSVKENRADRRRPLVAASVGPYGAALADGSEYRGDYGVDEETLYDFHRERWHLFADGPADLLACETVPSRAEVEVLLALFAETPDARGWMSLSCRDPEHLADGTPLARLARRFDDVPNLVAVGVNCVRPAQVEALLGELARHTSRPLLAYPNAGETWDADARAWSPPAPGSAPAPPEDWGAGALRWVAAGAAGVGGCCRVGPEVIRAMREALDSRA